MIARNILNLRKAANLTQEQIAERIGVARQTIAKWENGDSVPDIDSCSRIADMFNVSLDDLVNYSGGETPAGPLPPQGEICVWSRDGGGTGTGCDSLPGQKDV